jgi:hypothetical protein
VLVATSRGYEVAFARAVLEHAGGIEYASEVREAVQQAGVVVVHNTPE